jgi:hypothetical protein
MDGWKIMLAWHYNGNCKLVILELHNSCFYIVAIELHELHMYTITHMASCIHCNSCVVEIYWIVMKLQMIILQFKNPITMLITNHLISHNEKKLTKERQKS